jgi:hypothetical protein
MPEMALVVESQPLLIEPLTGVHPALACPDSSGIGACMGCFPSGSSALCLEAVAFARLGRPVTLPVAARV